MTIRHGSVVIDAGHGGSSRAGNSSAYGVRGPRGAVEKDAMLALAQRVAAHYGSGSVLTRTADINLTLAERTSLAQRYGSAVFVSLHANSGPPGARGAEAYVHDRGTARSMSLADSIQRELGAYGHAVAPIGREALAVLSPDRLPPQTAACLLEVDYLSDAYGEQRLTDASSLDRLGAAIARGIRRYVGGQPAVAEGQVAPAVIIGIIGIGIGAFALINALEARNVGGLTWSRNISKVTHSYSGGQSPGAWSNASASLLQVFAYSGLSSTGALFWARWRANGNDIDQCRVEKEFSHDWDSSLMQVTFEGVDAASFERNSVGCIMMHVNGTLDPAGTGDIDFMFRTLVKADGTMVNDGEFRVTRGDAGAFRITAGEGGSGYKIEKA